MKFNKKIWKEIQALWQNVVDTSFRYCERDVIIERTEMKLNQIIDRLIDLEIKMFNILGDEFE